MEIVAQIGSDKPKKATFKGKSEAQVLASVVKAAKAVKAEAVEILSVKYQADDDLDLYPRLFERLADAVNSHL